MTRMLMTECLPRRSSYRRSPEHAPDFRPPLRWLPPPTPGVRVSAPDSSPQPFLSDAWIENARALRAEFDDQIPEPPIAVRMNVVVTDIDHRSDGALDGHIDTSSGEVIIENGHLDDPELTVTVDYGTAKAAFVDRDPQAVMQAFFAGKILVEGDVSRLMALQAEEPNDAALEMYQRLSDMTSAD